MRFDADRNPCHGASAFAIWSAVQAVACQQAGPQCQPRVPTGFEYPAGTDGTALAEYLAAFDSGDASRVQAFARKRMVPHDAAIAPLGEYEAMRGTLGCLQPQGISQRDGETVLLVSTTKEGYFELSFDFDSMQRVVRVQGAPAMPPGQNEPASLAAAIASVGAESERLAKEDRFSGVVLVSWRGETLLARAFALANRERGTPNSLETRFNVGSIGKMFTAVAIGRLVEDGRLRFDQKVGEVLRDYPLAAGRSATIAQVLTHTGGFGDVDGFLDARPPLRTPSDFIARFGSRALAFPPGQGHRYSNFGYVILGRIIEVVSGERFDDYLRAHVFSPAGMTVTGSIAIAPVDVAVPYTRRPESGSRGERRDASSLVPPPTPFGCEYASAWDLVRFGDALFKGRLLGSTMVRELTTGRVRTGAGEEREYGYGFGEEHVRGVRFVQHDGGTYGVSTSWIFAPEDDVSIVVLANDDPPAAARLAERAKRLVAATVSAERWGRSEP